MTTIIPVPALSDNYIWLIIDKKEGVFDCVDPGIAEPILAFASSEQLKLRTILLTHHHQDHIGGTESLIKQFPSCVVYGPNDARIPHRNHTVQEHQNIQIGACSFKVLFNPGHTATHISYYEAQQGWLFCGDTLFSAGCGRVFDGTLEELHASMLLFKTLPATTKIFCAHEYTRKNLQFAQTVEPDNRFIKEHLQKLNDDPLSCSLPSLLSKELCINPFLRTEVPEVADYAKEHGASSRSSLEVFRILRRQKDMF